MSQKKKTNVGILHMHAQAQTPGTPENYVMRIDTKTPLTEI